MPAPYFITGPVGASKTSTMVNLIVGYLNEGRPVATNIDLFPEHMPLNELGRKTPIIRIPEEPRPSDLDALGFAYPKGEGYDESRNGGLFVDETAFFLNSREWQKKDRQELINWFRLVRKRGWNAFLAVQDMDSVDKQIINSLCRSVGWCYTSDNFLKGGGGNILLSLILLPLRAVAKAYIKWVLRVPRIHMCTFYGGKSVSSGVKQDTVMAKGMWLYKSYDTKQEFHDGTEMMETVKTDDKGRVYARYRDPSTNQMTEGFVRTDVLPMLKSCTVSKVVKSVDFRASYTMLPADYILRWYHPEKAQIMDNKKTSLSTFILKVSVFLAVNFLQIFLRFSKERALSFFRIRQKRFTS